MWQLRMPDPVRGPGGTLAAIGAVATPMLILPLVSPDVRTLTAMASASSIVAYIAVLFATGLIYLYWRSKTGPIGWLVVALAPATLQALAMAGMAAVEPAVLESHPGWVAISQIVVALGVGSIVLIAPGRTLRVDPLLVGILVGFALVALRYLVIATSPSLNLSPTTVDAMRAVVLIANLAITFELFLLTAGPDWARFRLACAWGILSLGNAMAYPTAEQGLLAVVSIVANVLGASMMLAVAVALHRLSLVESREQFHLVNSKLEQVEADLRMDEARLHEIRSTIAGLTSASQVINQADSVDNCRRHQIEAMMASEMRRIQRLVHHEHVTQHAGVDLDALIEPLVLRHQLNGFPVRWQPTGERVLTIGDSVAEVINALLENAFQHAPGSGAWIYTRRTGAIVELAVSDSGPGVDSSIRDRIFEWGERGKASNGTGIGLNVAKQLTVELGGYLRLVDSPGLGATFVFGIPAEDPPS